MRVVKRLASFVVTLLLLVIMAIGLFLSIHNRWDFDLVIACTLVFTVIYVHVFENIIPVKPQWGMVGEDLAPDILHFIALIFFSVLGNIAALSLTLHLHGWLGMELGFWNQFAFIPFGQKTHATPQDLCLRSWVSYPRLLSLANMIHGTNSRPVSRKLSRSMRYSKIWIATHST